MILGKVVDVEDPKKLSRIKVEIPSMTEGIDKEMLPFYLPVGRKNTHDLPQLDEIVKVILIEGDVKFGYWERLPNPYEIQLSDDDYRSAKVLLYRDLSKEEDEGIIEISYKKSIGLQFTYKESSVILRPDQTIFVKSKKADKVIHINDGISLGKEDKSAEPGVLGDKNLEALTKINDTIKELVGVIDANCKKLGTAAGGNPYTANLVAPFNTFAAEVKAKIEQLLQQNKDFFPKTKSEIVTLD